MPMPLLRWPGGKRWLAPLLAPHLGAFFERYIEPFFGAGALFFALQPKRAVVSDINPELMNFYRVLKRDPNRLLAEFGRLAVSKGDYYRIRDEWKPRGVFHRSARFLYLLRYSWNGIYR